MTPKLEVCCFNIQSALDAITAGADRIEFCGGSASNGGTTPAFDDVKTLVKARDKMGSFVPIYVMVRPDANSFTCPKEKWEDMIAFVKLMGFWADGLVTGFLTADGRIDVELCAAVVVEARQEKLLPVTFHRAFDCVLGEVEDVFETVRRCGFEAILTSGGNGLSGKAVDGLERLKKCVEISNKLNREDGSHMEVIVGGSVRSDNLEGLVVATGARWFHSSASINGQPNVSTDQVRSMQSILKRA